MPHTGGNIIDFHVGFLHDEIYDASDAVMREGDLWRMALKRASRQGAAAVMALTPEQRKAFESFHDPVSQTFAGKDGTVHPSFTVTGGDEDLGPKLVPKLHMCEECFKVARKLQTCSKCSAAYYCGVACQKAAWTKHKPVCLHLRDYIGAHKPGGVLSRGPFLGAVLVPDRPQLCRFWLAALVNSLATVPVQLSPPLLLPLIAFLWRYTAAAIPLSLATPTAKAFKRLCRLHARDSKPASDDSIRKLTTQNLQTIAWLLDTEASKPKALAGLPFDMAALHREGPGVVREHQRYMQRAVTWGFHSSLVESSSYILQNVSTSAKHRPAAKFLAVVPHLRASGLLGSAFGALCARQRMHMEIARFALAAQEGTTAARLQQMAAPLYTMHSTAAAPKISQPCGADAVDLRVVTFEPHHQIGTLISELLELAADGVTSLPIRVGVPSADAADSAATAVLVRSTARRMLADLPDFQDSPAGFDFETADAVRSVYERALAPEVHALHDTGVWPVELPALFDWPPLALVS